MQTAEKHKVLVIEDSLLNQHIIQKILDDEYTLGMADTADSGYKAAHIFHPDLILLDIILPNANGFDLLARLKDDPETAGIPVIIITGLDGDNEEERGFLLGAVDYIRKPFKETIVKARVKTQVRLIKQIQTIERLGLMDALTGIYNRRHFDNQSKYEWGRSVRENAPLSLIMIDVDKFKVYNDTYGHPQGDVMLRTIAQVLKGCLGRSVDILCRYGGEEFVVMLPNTPVDGAAIVAERLRAAVENTDVENSTLDITTRATISSGLACTWPENGGDVSALLRAADEALYRAKQNGRNRVEQVVI